MKPVTLCRVVPGTCIATGLPSLGNVPVTAATGAVAIWHRMTALESTQAPRSAGKASLAIVAILTGVLGCLDRPVPFAPANSAAPQGFSGLSTNQPSSAELATAVRARLVHGVDPAFVALTGAERADLTALYQTEGGSPLWVDATGRPGHQARESLRLLGDAQSEGLDPADYEHDTLDRLAATLTSVARPLPEDVGNFDVALSRAMLRYFRHVHLGRIDSHAIGFRLKVSAEGHDFVALLRSALARDQIAGSLRDLRPALAQYGALRAMLARYRALAAAPSLESRLAAVAVRPGDPSEGLDVLNRQLVAFGDLPAGAPALAAPEAYEGTLVEGVKRFQRRHGLQPDGILGKGTQAALRVPVSWRVRQIELALERLRWLPDLGARRLVVVNIPMFRLWAWDSILSDAAPLLSMNVIVGRALDTQTPVFDEEMRDVIFRPYWNVPRSILRDEILPALEGDPDYMRQQDMEIVRGAGDDAQPVEASVENLALLRQGALRVRQRPGAQNALGLIKFDFPNQDNVYVHGTPAHALFGRRRRDFSHGCVRVEDPVALAEWALKGQTAWARDGIMSAMEGTQSFRVRLQRPIQVILFYTTAGVMPEDGTIHFAADIYRHDARLDRVLLRPDSSR